MCGIVGQVFAAADRAPDVGLLRRMASALRHRGPDDEGIVACGSAGLGVRRLKIIDLAGGHQPMAGEDERVWTAFNGEIYNYRELSDRLTALGHVFRSRSDTEALVHGFEAWGLDLLGKIDGMFAIAFWDRASRVLTLVRDRIGIKPLYYALLPGEIVFASEVRALLEHPGIGRELDVVALSRYLAHDFLPAPHAMLKAIRKLPPGHWLQWSDGRVKIEPYWDVTMSREGAWTATRLDDAVERLRETLDVAVRDHLVGDVPLGMFLSGGIDSAAVAAVASRHVSGRLQTFSIGFTERSFDESRHARRVAQALGTEHHEDVLDASAGLALVERLPDILDEPLGDGSVLPTYLLSRFARQSVTVALSGDGGDELFAGYPTYQAHRVAQVWARMPRDVRERVIRPIVERLPVSLENLSLDFRLKRFVAGVDAPPIERHGIWMGTFTPAEQLALLTDEAVSRMESRPSWQSLDEVAARVPDTSELGRLLYVDLRTYLAEGVLTKVDRASMACSLEVRPPLLDRRVVELAASLPDHLKLHGLTTKYVFKRAMAADLPRDIVHRAKKGFGVPLARWFRGPLRALLGEALAPESVRRARLFRPDAVERLVREHDRGERDHRKKLYTLLVFQLWSVRWGAS